MSPKNYRLVFASHSSIGSPSGFSKNNLGCMKENLFVIMEGAKRKVSSKDPVFGGSCVPRPLPPEDSNITGVPQAA